MGYKALRVIISGGGTGGHIFPAISIADQFKQVNPESEILFVGAEGKMEMEKVPAAGYPIIGLKISGLQRKPNLRNFVNALCLPFKVAYSIVKARKIIRQFKPDIAIGVGGYASAPLLFAATTKGIPSLIQEQNGFAGLTNKLLGKRVGRICVAYEGMDRFFPADKIVMTGNPIRKEMAPATSAEREDGIKFFGLNPESRHLLILGGSLGSRTLNNAVKKWIEDGCPGGEGVEIIWQCGKIYKAEIDKFMEGHGECTDIQHCDFIRRMDLAYAAADLIISRSGASSVSEFCATHKATVLVPSPNVAEDHQTHNAMALVHRNAAVMVRDADAVEQMMPVAIDLLHNPDRIAEMEKNAAEMALPDAALKIVDEAYKLLDIEL